MSAPKWASVYKNSAVKEREPSTATSEEILRSESVRFWNRRLSQAEKQAWADVCVPAIERFDSFCDAATIEKDDALQFESKETNYTQENLLQSFPLEPSISFPPELLPCMIVNPPPTCRLDRKAMVQALIQSQKKQSRRAIIHLPRLLPTLRQNFGIIWRQILNQEPSMAIKQFAQKKIGRNKKAQSLQKWILLWASQTENFDQITIFLEDAGSFLQSEIRKKLFHALSQWRSEHGLPISLIVIGTEDQVRDLCPFGVRIQLVSPLLDFATRTRKQSKNGELSWINRFFRHLMNHESQSQYQTPPPVLWEITSKLLQDYFQRQRSCTILVRELRQLISHFYTTKGSFVWDIEAHNPDFVAWFCTYTNANKLFANHEHGWEKFEDLQNCNRIQQKIHYYWEGIAIGLPLYIGDIEEMSLSTTMPIMAKLYAWTKRAAATNKEHVLKMIRRHLDPREICSETENSALMLNNKDDKIGSLINEMILLLDAQEKERLKNRPSAKVFQDGVFQMIQNLFQLMGEQLDACNQQWKDSCPLRIERDDENVPFTNEINLRHDIVEGLPQPAKTMYQLLEGRLSVVREDWLRDFGGTAHDFILGTWFLHLSGLIHKKHSRGGKIIYEKVPVVWT